MNEKIQHIIQEIRIKKDVLNATLKQQTLRVDELEQQTELFKSELEQKQSEISQLMNNNTKLVSDNSQLMNDNAQLKNDIAGLQSLLEETKNQIVNTVSADATKPYEQIDELVREIEYCIGQLKNNA